MPSESSKCRRVAELVGGLPCRLRMPIGRVQGIVALWMYVVSSCTRACGVVVGEESICEGLQELQ
jgi:hypothetical protein